MTRGCRTENEKFHYRGLKIDKKQRPIGTTVTYLRFVLSVSELPAEEGKSLPANAFPLSTTIDTVSSSVNKLALILFRASRDNGDVRRDSDRIISRPIPRVRSS